MKITTDALDLPGIRHGFYTRQGGVSDGIYASLNCGVGSEDERHRVLENRARVAHDLGVAAEKLATPFQIHSPDVAIVDDVWATGAGPKADAVVTARPGIAVGIGTADCGPLLFADPAARVIGAAHAGWRGAFTGVIEATIGAMEALGADRRRITVVLGPTISASAYEVGPEFIARFATLMLPTIASSRRRRSRSTTISISRPISARGQGRRVLAISATSRSAPMPIRRASTLIVA